MKRSVSLSLVAAATFACLCSGAGQAATLTSGHLDASSVHALGLVTKAGWHRGIAITIAITAAGGVTTAATAAIGADGLAPYLQTFAFSSFLPRLVQGALHSAPFLR